MPPTRASLIMSLESVFSVIGGALLLGETMTVRGYLGCALIFAGIVRRADARCRPQTIGGEQDRKTGSVNAIGECDRKTRKTESR